VELPHIGPDRFIGLIWHCEKSPISQHLQAVFAAYFGDQYDDSPPDRRLGLFEFDMRFVDIGCDDSANP
jgi:hypothetical protein